jgi:hypothetical protein
MVAGVEVHNVSSVGFGTEERLRVDLQLLPKYETNSAWERLSSVISKPSSEKSLHLLFEI